MSAMASPPYNGGHGHHRHAANAPQFAVAGPFLEALAAHDFERLAVALDADASLSALLPRGFDEWHGAADICAAFEQWFGDVDEFEVVDAVGGPGRLPAPAALAAARARRPPAATSPWSSSSTPTPTPARPAGSSSHVVAVLRLLQGAPRCLSRSQQSTAVAWGDWDHATRNDPYPLFESMRAECPVHQVRLADGHDAWLVLGHDAARQALKDARLSKDMVAALDQDPDVVDAGLPGPAFARHMLAVDPPDHTRLRRLVSRAFAPTRIAALEPSIERIAHELLDELEAAGPGRSSTSSTASPIRCRSA